MYDRIGRGQDVQAVFEHRAISDLLAHAEFEGAGAVFELGYGTGALAERLLRRYLPAESRYTGIDVSPHMHDLARRRLHTYLSRAELRLSDGALQFPFPDAAFDRFVACYVLDLLSDENISAVLREAGRLLTQGGLLCLASLTPGTTVAARGVTRIWQSLWSLRPSWSAAAAPSSSRIDSRSTSGRSAITRSSRPSASAPKSSWPPGPAERGAGLGSRRHRTTGHVRNGQ